MEPASIARRRLGAWLLDGLLVLGVSGIPMTGVTLGLAYWLLRDGLFQGQSVGKKILGLRVVNDAGRNPYAASALRNALWLVPVVNLVFAVLGLYTLFHDPNGRHWGDRLADTRVVAA